MPVGPLGSVIHTNQNMTAVSHKQTSLQNRIDMQNVISSTIANEKNKEVTEIRPAEETYKIDPENEHEKQKSEEESGAKEEETSKDTKNKHTKENENSPKRRLDIVV